MESNGHRPSIQWKGEGARTVEDPVLEPTFGTLRSKVKFRGEEEAETRRRRRGPSNRRERSGTRIRLFCLCRLTDTAGAKEDGNLLREGVPPIFVSET